MNGMKCHHHGVAMLKNYTISPSQGQGDASITWLPHQMETFSALLAIYARNSPHKSQWRGAFMFSLICAWIEDWVNNLEAGDLGCHRVHYGVVVMKGNGTTLPTLCAEFCKPLVPLQRGPIYYITRRTAVTYKQNINQILTNKNTPYLALTEKLCSVCGE